MYLGIEIGGTKLQLGVGPGDGVLATLVRLAVQPEQGASGILRQIQAAALPLIQQYPIQAVGFGFGGPVDGAAGKVLHSHQVAGWNGFPLADWCRDNLHRPAVVANDSDSAGLAEAVLGAGRGHRVVVYSNVGSGIGGALVLDGHLHSGSSGIAAEIGHLRPGLQAEQSNQTVESLASGWAIAATVRERLAAANAQGEPPTGPAAELLARCGGDPQRLTTQIVSRAAADGNPIACAAFSQACRAFGWALAQVLTLVAPSVLVIGGGVSLAADEVFLEPLRQSIARYVFPPLTGNYAVLRAALGEEVVVHGALLLASRSVVSST